MDFDVVPCHYSSKGLNTRKFKINLAIGMEIKGQISFEYMAIFAFATGLIGLIFSVVGGLNPFTANSTSGGAASVLQSSCNISVEFNCIGMSASSSTGNVVMTFANNAGATLMLPPGSFMVQLGSSQYTGSCTPSTVPYNSKTTCTANVGAGTFKPGAELTPTFRLGYEGCVSGLCESELNITGTATVYAS